MVNKWIKKPNPINNESIYLVGDRRYKGNGDSNGNGHSNGNRYVNKYNSGNGNNGSNKEGVVNMVILEENIVPKEKTVLELFAKKRDIDPFFKLYKIRDELEKCRSEEKHLTKEEYSRWRVLGKEISEEYAKDSVKEQVKNSGYGEEYIEDVLSELNSYLRAEHKRLQDEIYHNTSLDIVLENRQRGIKQSGDIETRLRDINGYLNVANEKNKARDKEKTEEIKSSFDGFFHNKNIEFGRYLEDASKISSNVIKYMEEATGGEVTEAHKSDSQETVTKKGGWLRKMGKVAAGVAVAAASLGSIFAYATSIRNHEKTHENLPQKTEVAEFPKINYDPQSNVNNMNSQNIRGPFMLESILNKEIRIEDYSK